MYVKCFDGYYVERADKNAIFLVPEDHNTATIYRDDLKGLVVPCAPVRDIRGNDVFVMKQRYPQQDQYDIVARINTKDAYFINEYKETTYRMLARNAGEVCERIKNQTDTLYKTSSAHHDCEETTNAPVLQVLPVPNCTVTKTTTTTTESKTKTKTKTNPNANLADRKRYALGFVHVARFVPETARHLTHEEDLFATLKLVAHNVAQLHSKKYIFCDLTPSNVLVERRVSVTNQVAAQARQVLGDDTMSDVCSALCGDAGAVVKFGDSALMVWNPYEDQPEIPATTWVQLWAFFAFGYHLLKLDKNATTGEKLPPLTYEALCGGGSSQSQLSQRNFPYTVDVLKQTKYVHDTETFRHKRDHALLVRSLDLIVEELADEYYDGI